jgi:hypothetical protein
MARKDQWTAEPGRHIHFEGRPFAHIDRESGALPVEADALVHVIVEHLNRSGMTPADLYEHQMGMRPHPGAGREGDFPRRVGRKPSRNPGAREDRETSMTYGQLPTFEQFERDVHTRIDPEGDGEQPYWPEGTLYPMELVSNHEIELAETFGLEEFKPERQLTGRNTRVRGFRDNERAIYEFIEFLADRWHNGDEEAGDFASSIMYTLGYEWI